MIPDITKGEKKAGQSGRGANPKSETLGFLTKNKRDFLKMGEEERAGIDPGMRSRYKSDILKKVPLVLEDLLLVLNFFDSEDLKSRIDPDHLASIVWLVTAKLGREVSTFGQLDTVLMNALEAGMNDRAWETRKYYQVEATTGTGTPQSRPSVDDRERMREMMNSLLSGARSRWIEKKE